MKPTKLCLLLLAVNAASVARHFPSALAQPLPERRVLSGRVTDDAGSPLPRINVTLQRENDLGANAFWGTVAVTDAQGRFRIENAEDGAYLISAEGDKVANVQNQHLRIDANSTIWDVQLQRLTTLRLVLKDAQGAVVPKARASLRLSKTSNSNANNNSVAFARKTQRRVQTNDKGELQMPNIEPGSYGLDIALPGVGFAKIDDFAVKYEAKPGARDIQLQRGGGVTLIAREAGENGRLLGGAVLTLGEDVQITAEQRAQGAIVRQDAMDLGNLYAWSSDGSRAVTSDGNGELALQDLAPGKYVARLILPGYAPSEAQNFAIQSGQNQTLTFDLKSRSTATTAKFLLQSAQGAAVADRDWTLQLRFLQPVKPSPKKDAPANETLLPDTLTMVPPEANLALPLEDAPMIEIAPPQIVPPMPGGMGLEAGEELTYFPGVMTRRVRSDKDGQFALYPLQAGRWMLTIFPTPQDDGGPRGPISQQTIDIDANAATPITLKMQ